MVCIAAFIILALVGLFVAIISIFKREVGRKYLQIMKKSWGCVGKKIRLQKCETNFKEDVKNSLLRKVVLKRPKLVKPLSILLEVLAVVIIVVVVWAIFTSIKAILALAVFGSCNVSKPSSCALGAETCSIDAEEPRNVVEHVGRWFEEWGEIFQAIPDRLHDWPAVDYKVEPYVIAGGEKEGKELAIDIFDPGCSACMQSYKNQLQSGFFDKYNTILMPYPIELPDGTYKFKNSGIITRYMHAATLAETDVAEKILRRIYTESNKEGINWQSVFNNELSEEEAEKTLKAWLKEWKINNKKITAIAGLAKSDKVDDIMKKIKDIVENKIKVKGIPTLIYDNQLHTGLYKIEGQK